MNVLGWLRVDSRIFGLYLARPRREWFSAAILSGRIDPSREYFAFLSASFSGQIEHIRKNRSQMRKNIRNSGLNRLKPVSMFAV
jgi:hypothetical protein